MAINKDPAAFTIQVRIKGFVVGVDLTNPAYEQQVMAAAARFASMRRKTRRGGRGGGRPPKATKEATKAPMDSHDWGMS